MTLISVVLPTALVLAFCPELFQSADPEKLGCHGPLGGLGMLSGILMAGQMKLAMSEYKVHNLKRLGYSFAHRRNKILVSSQ